MKSRDWAINAAYAFMANRRNGTKLSDLYRILGCSISDMNKTAIKLFGTNMTQTHRRLRAGKLKAVNHFEPLHNIRLTKEGRTRLASAISREQHIRLDLADVDGIISEDGTALLLIRATNTGVKGSRIVKVKLGADTTYSYTRVDNVDAELRHHIAKNNLINELSILECARD